MKTIEFKLYLSSSQSATIESWMRACCFIYNTALDQRIKSYSRRSESVTYNSQQSLLSQQRKRISSLLDAPSDAERDALRRVDRGMKSFFCRVKSGRKPGFPRFKPLRRYNSIEFCANLPYMRSGDRVWIPKIGLVRIRSACRKFSKTQKVFRIIRRQSGWYGQVVTDDALTVDSMIGSRQIGVDVGLLSFATTSNGDRIDNPQFYRKSQKRISGMSRSVSRKRKGSKNRKKAVKKLARHHEKVSLQRRNFCHQHSTDLVRGHSLIAVESLNIRGMVKSRCFSKSISDAGWGIFLRQLKAKAANAGRLVVEVNPSGTSQTCPDCGAVKKKNLRERVHNCECGLVIDRDHAAARVILSRALAATGATRLRRDPSSDSSLFAMNQDGPMKQENVQMLLPKS